MDISKLLHGLVETGDIEIGDMVGLNREVGALLVEHADATPDWQAEQVQELLLRSTFVVDVYADEEALLKRLRGALEERPKRGRPTLPIVCVETGVVYASTAAAAAAVGVKASHLNFAVCTGYRIAGFHWKRPSHHSRFVASHQHQGFTITVTYYPRARYYSARTGNSEAHAFTVEDAVRVCAEEAVLDLAEGGTT